MIVNRCTCRVNSLLLNRTLEEELLVVVQYIVVDLLLDSLDRMLDQPMVVIFAVRRLLLLTHCDVIWLLELLLLVLSIVCLVFV